MPRGSFFIKAFMFAVVFLAMTFSIKSQTVYENIEQPVYQFLERISVKNVVDIPLEVKPFSRMEIAAYLVKIEKNSEKLTSQQKADLNWYLSKYNFEMQKFKGENIQQNSSDILQNYKNYDFTIYDYEDKNFKFQIHPQFGYDFRYMDNGDNYKRWWGFHSYSYYGDWFGINIDMRDQGEYGENLNKEKSFTPKRGYDEIGAPDGFEYSDVRGEINFDWGWGRISLRKDYNQWGSGAFDKLILSDKAASYPHILLNLKPVEWLRFYYMHGWLHSGVIDSSRYYVSYAGSLLEDRRYEWVDKQIAINLLAVSPNDWLDISFGNSIVYTGDLRAEFFIPFMFFKYLDRDVGKGSIEDGNGALFLDLQINYFKSLLLYSSFYLEVTEIRNVLESDFHNTWFGFNFGAKAVDVIENLDITFEYTRINPWVYEHREEGMTYKHIDYSLGHWIGQNADQLRLQFDYYALRGLKLSLFGERVRKGGEKNIYYAYKEDDREPFLYGDVREDHNLGVKTSYEFIHNGYAELSYQYSDISDENNNRTPGYLLDQKHKFSFGFSYGL